jgi:hypothetical protein
MENLQSQPQRRASLIEIQFVVLFTSFWLTRVIVPQKDSLINLNQFYDKRTSIF